MDAPEAIVSAVGGAGAVVSVVGWFVRQAFKDNKDALAKLTASVDKLREEQSGIVGRVSVIEAAGISAEKQFVNIGHLLSEHGKQIAEQGAKWARMDERSSGEKRRRG